MPEGFQNLLSLDVPHLDQYFGVWAIEEAMFQSAVDRVSKMSLHAHVSDRRSSGIEMTGAVDLSTYEVMGDSAVIALSGPLMKFASSVTGGTSTVIARRQLRKASEDSAVKAILLRIDSPGGTVAGTQDLGDDIAAAKEKKPVYAYIEDLGASAAYWLASQATKVFSNRTALIGSIGTFMVLYDESARAEMEGVKVHVIKAGEHKGSGVPGTEVTQDQLAEWQRLINETNEHFLKAVAKGRDMSTADVRKLADGRVHGATHAKAAGLIDGVQSFDETLSQLQSKSRSKRAMEKTPASLAELKATFPNSTAEWRESQIESSASLLEASVAYARHVEAKATDERTAHARALEEAKAATKVAGRSLGHQPITARTGDEEAAYEGESGDAVEDFNAAVSKIAGRNADLSRRQRAVRQAASSKPDLYRAYLLATNPGKKQSRLICEKLESVGDK